MLRCKFSYSWFVRDCCGTIPGRREKLNCNVFVREAPALSGCSADWIIFQTCLNLKQGRRAFWPWHWPVLGVSDPWGGNTNVPGEGSHELPSDNIPSSWWTDLHPEVVVYVAPHRVHCSLPPWAVLNTPASWNKSAYLGIIYQDPGCSLLLGKL